MPEELTPEQKMQLASWVEQRDALLVELSDVRTAVARATKRNEELAISNTDLEDRIKHSEGRIEELAKRDEISIDLVKSEMVPLYAEKARLQEQILGLYREVATSVEEKNKLNQDIIFARDTYKDISERILALEKVTEHVTRVSSQNIKDVENMIAGLKASCQGVIDINTENVKKTNNIVNELPRLFFEMQKQAPIKKTFPIK